MARAAKAGRNDPCPCGSGKKYKRCCEAKQTTARGGRVLMLVVGAIIVGAIAVAVSSLNHDSSGVGAAGSVWSPEHGHFHPR
jgi:hypothetical protein